MELKTIIPVSNKELEQFKIDGYCGIAYDKEGEFYDAMGNVETVRTFANDGYRVVAIGNDGVVEKDEIQRIANYELECAIDCFGEDHYK